MLLRITINLKLTLLTTLVTLVSKSSVLYQDWVKKSVDFGPSLEINFVRNLKPWVSNIERTAKFRGCQGQVGPRTPQLLPKVNFALNTWALLCTSLEILLLLIHGMYSGSKLIKSSSKNIIYFTKNSSRSYY